MLDSFQDRRSYAPFFCCKYPRRGFVDQADGIRVEGGKDREVVTTAVRAEGDVRI
jgi:hypothetical protein